MVSHDGHAKGGAPSFLGRSFNFSIRFCRLSIAVVTDSKTHKKDFTDKSDPDLIQI
jgi:hypothetical protein